MREPEAVSAAEEPISVILGGIRLSDSFYCKSSCYGAWGFANPPGPGAIFHFVVEGGTTIETADGTTVDIGQGDLALLTQGCNHVLKSEPNAPIFTLDTVALERTGVNSTRMTLGSSGKLTVIVCGGVTFAPPWHPIFEILPPILFVRQNEQECELWIKALVSLMAMEVSGGFPGSEAIITRLSEVLVIGAIRNWMLNNVDDVAGWILAIRDRNLGRAIARIHQTPSKNWTVGSLATEAALSRTAFAERFTAMVGIPPMQYLSHLRMNLAGDMLRDSDRTIGEIARKAAYGSEISFSRAFKKFWGKPPGSFRRHPEECRHFGINPEKPLGATLS